MNISNIRTSAIYRGGGGGGGGTIYFTGTGSAIFDRYLIIAGNCQGNM